MIDSDCCHYDTDSFQQCQDLVKAEQNYGLVAWKVEIIEHAYCCEMISGIFQSFSGLC